ncbi:MAG: RagB/SusD family nutrient uptake outer membrane protein [Prevotella sp.]|nr:RagB/SusD family nutrient uptake outer membrane protein [Prevotella sp.]
MIHIISKTAKELTSLLFVVCSLLFSVACSDFFEQESENVVYSSEDHLSNWSDSVYSVMGILGKMQVIADRTILLGEVRGDLVTLTNTASADLRELANFNADDDNIYNQPRDYYAIINNCNYFIEHADTALKSNRNEYIFMKEYAAVKAFRAWTYLQLALNYGSVPFITKPILTKEESELDYPRYDLAQICQYFIDDLATLPARYDNEFPGYGDDVRSNHSHHFFFPPNILRGDLYLWLGSTMGKEAGKPYFEKAALCYYKYINERNTNSYYATGVNNRVMWSAGETSWVSPVDMYMSQFSNESFTAQSELITMIPGDSIRAEGNYSELRNLFNSREENNYQVSILPSKYIEQLSDEQANCVITNSANTATYAPSNLTNHKAGDLRLWSVWTESWKNDDILGRIETQYIYKYNTRNVHIYRRTMIYLRLAEALNLAGQPLLAFKILERGLNDDVITDEVMPYISKSDSAWVDDNINFSTTVYPVLEAAMLIQGGQANTMGVHTRGSGFTPMNDYYKLDYQDVLPYNFVEEDSTWVFDDALYADIKQRQMEQVDSLILNENALECCFEGTRYYDLMRFAMRSDNPGRFLTDHVNQRGGVGTSAGIDLYNRQNWYLHWGNGKIGF